MKISFTPGAWEDAGLVYAYSWRFEGLPVFCQDADCIRNGAVGQDPGMADYDYLGLVAPASFSVGAGCTLRCGFEGTGAPMLVLCDRREIDENGVFRTLDYYEIVLYKNGLNVWRMVTRDRQVTYHNVLRAFFFVPENEAHLLSLHTRDRRFLLSADEREFELYIPELTGPFYLGCTACEGVCRLYELEFDKN